MNRSAHCLARQSKETAWVSDFQMRLSLIGWLPYLFHNPNSQQEESLADHHHQNSSSNNLDLLLP